MRDRDPVGAGCGLRAETASAQTGRKCQTVTKHMVRIMASLLRPGLSEVQFADERLHQARRGELSGDSQ